jgi:hypothetical protein
MTRSPPNRHSSRKKIDVHESFTFGSGHDAQGETVPPQGVNRRLGAAVQPIAEIIVHTASGPRSEGTA